MYDAIIYLIVTVKSFEISQWNINYKYNDENLNKILPFESVIAIDIYADVDESLIKKSKKISSEWCFLFQIWTNVVAPICSVVARLPLQRFYSSKFMLIPVVCKARIKSCFILL